MTASECTKFVRGACPIDVSPFSKNAWRTGAVQTIAAICTVLGELKHTLRDDEPEAESKTNARQCVVTNMSSRLTQALRRIALSWALGLSLLGFLWIAPLTRRLAAGLVRLAIAVIAPALSSAKVEHDPAVPTWMFALGIAVAGALLGLSFWGAYALWRAQRARR